MKLDLKQWQYNGMPLAPPLQLARRLIVIPFAQLFRVLYVGCILLGWGKADAKVAWEDTE